MGNGAEQLIHNMFHIIHPTYGQTMTIIAKQIFMDLYKEDPLKCSHTIYDGILPLLPYIKKQWYSFGNTL